MKRVFLALLTVCVLAACSGVSSPVTAPRGSEGAPAVEADQDTVTTPTSLPTKQLTIPTTSDTEGIMLTMRSDNFLFDPNTITAGVGQPVTITITNTGTHDFVIDELGVRQVLTQGENTITFTPDKEGIFQFYCSIGEHRAMGMWGTITVTK